MTHRLLLAAALLVALLGCRGTPQAQTFGAPTPGNGTPPNPVYLCDGITGACNVLGVITNPLAVSVTGAAPDGGTANVEPVDPYQGDLLNTLVGNNTAGVAGILIDAGTRSLFDINVTVEDTKNGWWQLFCGQYVPDAGGTAAASTVPNLQLRCPAGTICGQLLKAPLSCAGGVWYSSSTAGTLTTSNAPNFTITAAAIR